MNICEILFFLANPAHTASLELGEEVRQIEQKIRAAEHRDGLKLLIKTAVNPDDLIQALNQHANARVMHFSGHGSANEEIVLSIDGEPKPVSKAAMSALLKTLHGNLRLVVLNACYSKPQAEAIIEHVDCAIGMNKAIGDDAAIVFAASFYGALGFGKSVQAAFDQGIAALLLNGIPEDATPELMCRRGVAAKDVFVLNPPRQELNRETGSPSRETTESKHSEERSAVSYSREMARTQLQPFAARMLNSDVTRKVILRHNGLKADMSPERAASYLLESDNPMDVLFQCVSHELPTGDRAELTSTFWSLVEIVTPVCLVVTTNGELSDHLNGDLSHVGVDTTYAEIGKSFVGTIKCLPVDLREPDDFFELCHADLPEGNNKVASIPAPPELGAFQDVDPFDENVETIVGLFEKGLRPYLKPRTTVKAALAARAARGIMICVLMPESPGIGNLKALKAAFPHLVVLVSKLGGENEDNEFVLEQIDQIKEWLNL